MVPHWNLSPRGFQQRAAIKGMIYVFLMQSANITQAVNDDFAADQVCFGR